MRKDADNLGEAVRLENVQEFECFLCKVSFEKEGRDEGSYHFKPKTCVDH
jgi:hypothetical protein